MRRKAAGTALQPLLTASSCSSRANNSTTISSVIVNNGGGASGLTATGASANTLTLSGANTYPGATTVTGGTLKAAVASVANTSGAFGLNSAVTLANTAGVKLDITGFDTQIGSLAGASVAATGSVATVTLGANALTVGGDNTPTTSAVRILTPERRR